MSGFPRRADNRRCAALGDRRGRDLVARFIDAFEAGDVDTIVACSHVHS